MGENFLLFPIPTSRQLITACYSSFKGSKALFDLFGYPNTCVHVYMHMYIPPHTHLKTTVTRKMSRDKNLPQFLLLTAILRPFHGGELNNVYLRSQKKRAPTRAIEKKKVFNVSDW